MTALGTLRFMIRSAKADSIHLESLRGWLEDHAIPPRAIRATAEDESMPWSLWPDEAEVASLRLVLLSDDLVPCEDWLQALTTSSGNFDVRLSRVRQLDGSVRLCELGEPGTVLEGYVGSALSAANGSTCESWADRCRRFGFRIGECGGGPLERRSRQRIPSTPGSPDIDCGINLFGFFDGNLGLGVAARHYLRNLREAGLTLQPVLVPVSEDRRCCEPIPRDLCISLEEVPPHGVNLFILNPNDLCDLRVAGPPAMKLEGRVNVCLPFWELPVLPRGWCEELARMDVILAASGFLEYAYLAAVDGPVVRSFPHPLYLEGVQTTAREKWGLPERALVFLSSFEMASDVNRKNPYAAIDAFNRAFSSRDDAVLLIKINNARADPRHRRHLAALRAYSARNSQIVLFDQSLPYADVLSLYASADVYVSLHRAEGLGLGMLESMSLGKPVIATGWSGNMDFMNERNSCLVGYRFVPVEASTQGAYSVESIGSDLFWADPRIDEAAVWMRRLANEPDLRERIGKQAAADMAERQRRIGPAELMAALRNLRVLRPPPGA